MHLEGIVSDYINNGKNSNPSIEIPINLDLISLPRGNIDQGG